MRICVVQCLGGRHVGLVKERGSRFVNEADSEIFLLNHDIILIVQSSINALYFCPYIHRNDVRISKHL